MPFVAFGTGPHVGKRQQIPRNNVKKKSALGDNDGFSDLFGSIVDHIAPNSESYVDSFPMCPDFSILLTSFSPRVQPLLVSLYVPFSGVFLCCFHLFFSSLLLRALPSPTHTHTHAHATHTTDSTQHTHNTRTSICKRNEVNCSDMCTGNRPLSCEWLEQEHKCEDPTAREEYKCYHRVFPSG